MSNKYSIKGSNDNMELTLHIPVVGHLNIAHIKFKVIKNNKTYIITPIHCRDSLKNYAYFSKTINSFNTLHFQSFLENMIEYLHVSSLDYCSEIVFKTIEFLNNYKEMRNV